MHLYRTFQMWNYCCECIINKYGFTTANKIMKKAKTQVRIQHSKICSYITLHNKNIISTIVFLRSSLRVQKRQT